MKIIAESKVTYLVSYEELAEKLGIPKIASVYPDQIGNVIINTIITTEEKDGES